MPEWIAAQVDSPLAPKPWTAHIPGKEGRFFDTEDQAQDYANRKNNPQEQQ